jgi:hypothetical protein
LTVKQTDYIQPRLLKQGSLTAAKPSHPEAIQSFADWNKQNRCQKPIPRQACGFGLKPCHKPNKTTQLPTIFTPKILCNAKACR